MYSSWAQKQRKKILIGFGSIAFILLSAYITIGMYEPPSCNDEKKNQDETGVDCGGSCPLICGTQLHPLNTIWVRSFKVANGVWSSFAFIENPNPRAEVVVQARYRFTLYDRNNEVLREIDDSTFITQDTILPVFTGRIELGEQVPYRTEFTWLDDLVWTRSKEIYDIALEEQKLSNTNIQPEIHAVLVNKEPFRLEDVEIVAIVYDEDENAIAVSKTYVDAIPARGKTNITFVWPTPFEKVAKRWQLVPRVPTKE